MPQIGKLHDINSLDLLFATPTALLFAEEIIVLGVGCRPAEGWKPPGGESRWGEDYVDLGMVRLCIEGKDYPDHNAPARMLMDNWWRMHHADPGQAIVRAAKVIRHLEDELKKDKEAMLAVPTTAIVERVSMLTNAIHLADEAYLTYLANSAPTKIAVPIRLKPGRTLHVERRSSALGGPGEIMPVPLMVELYCCVRREIGEITLP